MITSMQVQDTGEFERASASKACKVRHSSITTTRTASRQQEQHHDNKSSITTTRAASRQQEQHHDNKSSITTTRAASRQQEQ
jgi:hypothetical protein